MASIRFIEESDYGQDVLQLLGEVSSLMDGQMTYTEAKINVILINIRVRAEEIQHKMSGKDKMPYFEGSS